MAFGQVQGGLRGCPSSPPGTDTFKGSRATRTQHRCGQRVPPREQDGRSHLVSLGPHPRASMSTSPLSTVKRGAGDMCGEACHQSDPQPLCSQGPVGPWQVDQLGGVGAALPAGCQGLLGLETHPLSLTLTTSLWDGCFAHQLSHLRTLG